MSISTDPTLTVEKVADVMENVKVDKRRQVWERVLAWEGESPVDQLYSCHSTERRHFPVVIHMSTAIPGSHPGNISPHSYMKEMR